MLYLGALQTVSKCIKFRKSEKSTHPIYSTAEAQQYVLHLDLE